MPARILTVAQQKGGAGKTTLVIQLATALAAAGRRVAVVDIDPQGSLTEWMRLREQRGPSVPELRFSMVGGWRLPVELDRLRGEQDVVVIDTPPHAETDAKVAVRSADLVLVPCQPSLLDVWASGATIELAAKERRKAVLVLNRVPPRGRSVDEARSAIGDLACAALDAHLGNRLAFAGAVARGLGAVETESRSPAADEARALGDEVLRRLG
ncbi:MAG TPA: ParA family partition ATPase [Geminicoccaceae bacterium]|nr:ParA family partition ATPase [Geminicoccus sp.]HMU52079.1 ParA family partition ATPase [Geminicoccaceae bacterium]